MRLLTLFFTAIIAGCSTQGFASPAYTDYELKYSNGSLKLEDFHLSDKELRWLNTKKNFIVAIDSNMQSALLKTEPTQQAKGISVDYLGLLQQNLKVHVVLRLYPGENEAASALEKGAVDMILTDLLNSPPEKKSFNISQPLITTFPTLVTNVNYTMSPLTTNKQVKIAHVKGYPIGDGILHAFPNATIVDYADQYEALSSVDSGLNQYFFGNNITTSMLISEYFPHSLNVIKYYNSPKQSNFFITRKETPELFTILNGFISSLSNEVRRDVIHKWISTGNLGYIEHPIDYTQREKKWMSAHPTVKVLIPPFYPPFSMANEPGGPRGIIGDLFNIIEIQTGMKFLFVTEGYTASQGIFQSRMNWDIRAGTVDYEKWQDQFFFSNVIMTSPYVYVINRERNKDQKIKPGMKIGLPSYYGLAEKLKKSNPEISWVAIDNPTAAFHLVQDGGLDALFVTQSTAKYMVDHYYPDSQVFFRATGVPDAEIAFAIPRGEPELMSILNKALNTLPDSEVLHLIDKWTKMPEIKIDTWNLYSKQFYIVAAMAISLITSSLLWGFYLLREVHRRRVIQVDLEKQVSFRKALSDSLPVPCYVIDYEGRILSYNRAFKKYFSPESYTNALLPLTNSASPLSLTMPQLSGLHFDEHGNRPVNICEIEISNGHVKRKIKHWQTICDMPASDDGVFICGWEDITETFSLIHELEIEKNKAINATVAKSQFLATMSHEIRTPVSSIMGFLEMLTQPSQSEKQKTEAIRLAYSTGQSLLDLIGEILDIDKIESGVYQLQPELIDMSEHLTSIYSSFHALANRKKILYSLNSSLVNHQLLMIDPQAIKQVLTNLLSNALKFTETGSVVLKAHINTQGKKSGDLILEVIDSGKGISAEEQELLFKPYSQTHCGRQQTGSGLGLMICKHLVEKMDGKILLKSQPGIGSTFIVTIPVSMHVGENNDKNIPKESRSLPISLQVLVADDNPTNRLLLTRQLNSLGYDVTEACDGEDALNKAQKNSYDLLITDVNMPQLDGFELTKTLRLQNNTLTIWGLTANAQIHERDRGLRSGMDLCLFKPLTLDMLKYYLSQLPPSSSNQGGHQQLDLQVLKENTDSNAELINELLLTFVSTTQDDLKFARDSLQTHDFSLFKSHIHRVHGSAEILNLATLSNICQQLESMPSLTEIETINRLMDSLDDLFISLRDEINRYLSRLSGINSL